MDQRDAHPLQDPDLRQPCPVPMSASRSPRTPPRARSRPSAAPIARWSAPTIAGRAITSTSQPGRSDGSSDRIASRSRRRTRFRTTAEPRARPVARPNRVIPSSVRMTRVARSGCDRIVPRSWSAAKILRAGEHHEPRRKAAPGRQADRRLRPRARRAARTRRPPGLLHSGAEAVFLGAVALLGLVGLLRHRACAGSSPSGLGVSSVIDPRRHVNAPIARCTGGARSSSGG